MKNKILTLYFVNVEEVHLGKDVFLAPYYLSKALDCDVRIVYPMKDSNVDLPRSHRGVRLIPICFNKKPIRNRCLKCILTLFYMLVYFVPSNYAMLFHYYRLDTVYYGLLYKILNPFGKLYLKLDADISALKYKDDYKNIFERKYKNLLHAWFSKEVDCVSCETSIAMNAIRSSDTTCYKFKDDMVFMGNGFDEEELEKTGIKVNDFFNKENIFITVGRIGTQQKNTEMLLDALNQVDLKDWKFYIIGGIEDDFKLKIKNFFATRPDLKDKIYFTGNISSKTELWENYNRAKVFVLTSRFEGCPLVFTEAARFNNYLVSTNVGSFPDLIESGVKGIEIKQEDSKSLALIMKAIIEGSIPIGSECSRSNLLSWSYVIKPVVKKIKGS